ncbi:MAG: hypothetical protein ACRD12_04025 [Acidimicrobiales bacterium]
MTDTVYWRVMTASILLAGLAAACGGGDPTPATATSQADRDRKAQQAGLDFAECMREHGIDVPDPEPGNGGFLRIGPVTGPGADSGGDSGGAGGAMTPPAGFEEADQACRHFLDDVIGEGGGQIDPAEQDRALKFAQCMRDRGIDMPDPDFSNGGISIQIGGNGVRPDSEAVKEAHEACEPLFGPRGEVRRGERS